MKQFRLFNLIWLAIAVAIICLDQLTKSLVMNHLQLYQAIKITPFFNILLSFNTGAAFGLFNQASGWQQWLFGCVAVVVSSAIVIILLRQPREQWLNNLGMSFILGGALGNLIDRLTLGYVIDFLHFHLGQWSWPIFNVADSMICIGAGLLLLSMLWRVE